MGDIVEFRNDINKTNNNIKSIFVNIIKSINKEKNVINNNETELISEFDYLNSYFESLISKIENRNWKSEFKEKKFIDYYNYFNNTMYEFSELDKTYFLSLFAYCSDINSSLLDENINYVKMIINCIDMNLNNISLSNVKIINSTIKDVTRPMIKEAVSNSEDPNYALYDIIDGLFNGRDVYTVSLWYKNNDKEKEIVLNEENISIDNIRDYYLNQENLRYINECNLTDDIEKYERDHEINSLFINAIYNIKGFNDEYQKVFIEVVKRILAKDNIDIQINNLINLTKLYLEYGDQITEFDIEDIEHYIELGGKKYENRRF